MSPARALLACSLALPGAAAPIAVIRTAPAAGEEPVREAAPARAAMRVPRAVVRAAPGALALPTLLSSEGQGAVYDGGARRSPVPAPAVPARPAAAAQAPAAPAPASGLDLAAIDGSARPCADFFQYACGAWLKSTPIPADEARWTKDAELHERNLAVMRALLEDAAAASESGSADADTARLGDFYAACMDEGAIEAKGSSPLDADLRRLARLGSLKDLAREVARLHAIGVPALFDFFAAQDYRDSRRMVAAAWQGGLSLPDSYGQDPEYYFKAENAEDRKAFVAHVARMFELAGDDPAAARREAVRVLVVETRLARVSADLVSLRDPKRSHQIVGRAAFAALSPSFDWDAYFAGVGAPQTTAVDATRPFFRGLESVLKATPLRQWRSYLRWQLIHDRASLLPARFADQDFEFFDKRLAGVAERPARWKSCVGRAESSLSDALGRLYVKKAFAPGAREATARVVSEIKEAMRESLEAADWMSPRTRRRALEKLAAVTEKIGHPDRWRGYDGLRVERDDALGNVDRATAFEIRRRLAQIGGPADRGEWTFMNPTEVNAGYDPLNNDIVLPAATLQPPYYDPRADPAALYGSIGSVAGHELTHAFDDEGRHYDARGNMVDWWTPRDERAFKARARGFVEQYGAYVAAKDPGGDASKDVRVDGELTLGENIADNGSTRLAYAAFAKAQARAPGPVLDGFTPAQRFFLGFAQTWCGQFTPQEAELSASTDVHAPNRHRVNGPLSNMPEFARAFSCRADDGMVSAAPVRLW